MTTAPLAFSNLTSCVSLAFCELFIITLPRKMTKLRLWLAGKSSVILPSSFMLISQTFSDVNVFAAPLVFSYSPAIILAAPFQKAHLFD